MAVLVFVSNDFWVTHLNISNPGSLQTSELTHGCIFGHSLTVRTPSCLTWGPLLGDSRLIWHNWQSSALYLPAVVTSWILSQYLQFSDSGTMSVHVKPASQMHFISDVLLQFWTTLRLKSETLERKKIYILKVSAISAGRMKRLAMQRWLRVSLPGLQSAEQRSHRCSWFNSVVKVPAGQGLHSVQELWYVPDRTETDTGRMTRRADTVTADCKDAC